MVGLWFTQSPSWVGLLFAFVFFFFLTRQKNRGERDTTARLKLRQIAFGEGSFSLTAAFLFLERRN